MKTIRINYLELSKNVNLMFCMGPPGSFGKDSNMVAWKAFSIQANQRGAIQIVYTDRYAVGENQSDSDNRVEGSIFRELTRGQSADLIDGPHGPIWGPPMYIPEGLIGFRNMTSSRRAMSIGTVRDPGPGSELAYDPTFAWSNVPFGVSVRAQLSHEVLCYVNLDYKEKDVIKVDISKNLIQTINLTDFGEFSTWILNESPEGKYTLARVGAIVDDVELSSALPPPPVVL